MSRTPSTKIMAVPPQVPDTGSIGVQDPASSRAKTPRTPVASVASARIDTGTPPEAVPALPGPARLSAAAVPGTLADY